jgi:hypothetical protein
MGLILLSIGFSRAETIFVGKVANLSAWPCGAPAAMKTRGVEDVSTKLGKAGRGPAADHPRTRVCPTSAGFRPCHQHGCRSRLLS